MKIVIIKLGIILLLTTGQFISAMEQGIESDSEHSIEYMTDCAEESCGNQTNSCNYSISNEVALPDILTWVIGEMCKNGNTNLTELKELLASERYDICQGFSVALHYNNIKIARFLAKRGAIDILKSKGTPESTIKRIMSFLYPEKSKTKNHAITSKLTNVDPLTLAVQLKDREQVKRLLEEKYSPNIVDRNHGNTPLHIAACRGDVEIVQLLICYGAEIDKKNKTGLTPLMLAAQMGHTAIGELLLTHGVKVNKKDKRCFTALWWARRKHKTEFEELLISWGGEEYAIVQDMPHTFKFISDSTEKILPSLQD